MTEKHNIKVTLEYDGSNYAGWQRLGNSSKKDSIQLVLEKTLSGYLNEDIKVIGSGRTDSGVHALSQVANFYCIKNPIPEILKNEINKRLPEDIRILHAENVDVLFHSRYSAKSKTYEYRIDIGETQSVFSRKYSCHCKEKLNISAMEQAAFYLLGTHDYKSFTSEKNDKKSTVRTIESIKIYHYDPGYSGNPNNTNELRISITGDGFLYNMVRILIGTLLEVGNGSRKPEDLITILNSKDRQNAGITVSSHALFLNHVGY